VTGALHVEQHGHGAPILLVHGTASSSLTWTKAMDPLARLGLVVAYDRRGCGRSARLADPARTTPADGAAEAAAVLRSLGAARAAVVGQSYGGVIALHLALRDPALVRALVLLEPPLFGLDTEARAWGEALAARLRRLAAEAGVEAVGEAFLRAVLGDAAWEGLPGAARANAVASGEAILAEFAGGFAAPAPADLAALAVPTLVVAGVGSPWPFGRLAERLAATIPGARLVPVEGGHAVGAGHPVVLDFLRSVLRD
jgi:pimeloyl-ACP methyl ester carboxylesterase